MKTPLSTREFLSLQASTHNIFGVKNIKRLTAIFNVRVNRQKNHRHVNALKANYMGKTKVEYFKPI